MLFQLPGRRPEHGQRTARRIRAATFNMHRIRGKTSTTAKTSADFGDLGRFFFSILFLAIPRTGGTFHVIRPEDAPRTGARGRALNAA
jgi:hypothetical protein